MYSCNKKNDIKQTNEITVLEKKSRFKADAGAYLVTMPGKYSYDPILDKGCCLEVNGKCYQIVIVVKPNTIITGVNSDGSHNGNFEINTTTDNKGSLEIYNNEETIDTTFVHFESQATSNGSVFNYY